jgi:3-hydroxybutyrate dehydrogenase
VQPLLGGPATDTNDADLPAQGRLGKATVDRREALKGWTLVIAMTVYLATAPLPSRRGDGGSFNLSAVFHATRVVLPQMLARGWGRIINVASTHGLVASAHKSAYVAAKHGVVGLTKVVALETAETGVTCNAICPGWVLTPLVAKQIEDRARDEGRSAEQAKLELLEEKQPSKEFVTVEQLGGLAVFLCAAAADQIRGQAIAMDGGWTVQ